MVSPVRLSAMMAPATVCRKKSSRSKKLVSGLSMQMSRVLATGTDRRLVEERIAATER